MDTITGSLPFRAIVVVGLATLLAWQVVSRTLVSYLANIAPDAALQLRSTDPNALLNLADKMLNVKQTAASTELSGPAVLGPTPDATLDAAPELSDQIRTWSETALKLAGDKQNHNPASDGQVGSDKTEPSPESSSELAPPRTTSDVSSTMAPDTSGQI